MDGSGSVIVPLYVYPSAGAWDPVYDMYETSVQLVFVTVFDQGV
jgi:hypothetical protein